MNERVRPCPYCGQRKVLYPTRKDARDAARTWSARPGRTLKARAYPCDVFWHLTTVVGGDAVARHREYDRERKMK